MQSRYHYNFSPTTDSNDGALDLLPRDPFSRNLSCNILARNRFKNSRGLISSRSHNAMSDAIFSGKPSRLQSLEASARCAGAFLEDWSLDATLNVFPWDIHFGDIIPTPQNLFALGLPSDLLGPTTIIPHPKSILIMKIIVTALVVVCFAELRY